MNAADTRLRFNVKNAIELKNVGKRFGATWAVKNLDLVVPAGSIFAFLGPNGAGKTTTLRLISGLLFPTQGSISVLGMNPLRDWIPVRKALSYIPDIPFLYGKLTGDEFLRFVGGLHEIPTDTMNRRIQRFVSLFDLQQYHGQRVESYSHGTRQKYVVTAALISRPEVLLVDEPMVGLDPMSSRILKDLFREQVDHGTSILLSTHTLSVAQELADYIGVIDHGSLVISGSRNELLTDTTEHSLEKLFLSLTAREDR